MEIIGVIVAGIIIGMLGKWVAPGDRDKIPFWLTILCGIAGVIVGWYIAAGLGVEATSGVDWIRWIVSILVAAVFVMAAATITGRRKTKLRDRL
jgi:uncharacterized membrane protein YeaQ/YmgE (transglycosylase-associated protein family)